MSLSLKVKGKHINIELLGEEIIEYRFKQEAPNSLYAKGMFDCFMEIKGNIAYMAEHSFAELEAIREWVDREFDGDGYYNFVEVSFTHGGEVVRTTTFPDAYVTSYEEDMDTHSGQGIFTLVVRQKLDKMDYYRL